MGVDGLPDEAQGEQTAQGECVGFAPPMATATTWPWRLEGMSSVRAVWPSIVTGIVEGSESCG